MRVKGSALRARVQWVERHGDVAAWLPTLQPATRALVTAGVLVNNWYDFAAFVDLNESIDRLYGKGDLALCRELGRFGCDVNLTTLYKLFFKIGSVPFIVRRGAAAWRVNYDAGELRLLDDTGGRLHLRIEGWPQPHRAHCLSVLGWITRAIELSGGRVVDEIERCRARGEAECAFELRWR